MICKCGGTVFLTEEPVGKSKRRITKTCQSCYYRDIELRTSSGALIRWTHDFHKPIGDDNASSESTDKYTHHVYGLARYWDSNGNELAPSSDEFKQHNERLNGILRQSLQVK